MLSLIIYHVWKKDYSLITNKRLIDTKGTIFNIGPFLLHKCKEKSQSPVDIEWVLDLIFVIKDVCCFYSITVYFCVVLVLYLKWKIKVIFFFLYIGNIFLHQRRRSTSYIRWVEFFQGSCNWHFFQSYTNKFKCPTIWFTCKQRQWY